MDEMISVGKARKLLLKNTEPLDVSQTTLDDACGAVLASHVTSPLHLPPFDQSAVDGFAYILSDQSSQKQIRVIGEAAAGKIFPRKINSGEAVRIFTGAPVPEGADMIVMQEDAELRKGLLFIKGSGACNNIRKRGSQIKKGQIALKKGTVLKPSGVGYLAAMGIGSVNIIPRPRVTVIVTGSELKKTGALLNGGEIYDANSHTLQAALDSIGLSAQSIICIKDSRKRILSTLKKAVRNSDLVLVAGGISVGKYDFVKEALQQEDVSDIFYKIRQRPGKPLFFGKKERSLIFALPGNPAAVLTCFYEYVFPALNIMRGRKDVFPRKVNLPLAKDYNKKPGLSLFLKGKINSDSVMPLGDQASFMLSSFAIADCLIYLPEEKEDPRAGEIVEAHLLPGLY